MLPKGKRFGNITRLNSKTLEPTQLWKLLNYGIILDFKPESSGRPASMLSDRRGNACDLFSRLVNTHPTHCDVCAQMPETSWSAETLSKTWIKTASVPSCWCFIWLHPFRQLNLAGERHNRRCNLKSSTKILPTRVCARASFVLKKIFVKEFPVNYFLKDILLIYWVLAFLLSLF